MEWRTRITELLDCKYPILEEQLREDIRKCRDATDGSFGVNLSIGICPQIEEMLEVCIEEGVQVETAIYKPDALAPRIKESGVKWIHKTARVKDALHAEELGADAVIVVGLEGVGFKNPEQLPTFTTTTWGTKQLKVPFIAAGGIGDQLRYRVLSSSDPAEYERVLKMRDKLSLEEWLPMLERIQPRHSDWAQIMGGEEQSEEKLSRVGSLAVGAINSIPTVKEFIDGIIREAEEILDSWEFLKTR